VKKLLLVAAVLGGLLTAGCEAPTLPVGDVSVSLNTVTADGSASATTTKLTLTFSQDISGLGADDVTLSPGTTGAEKGELTGTETGVYELALSGITAGGEVSVAVSKAGYAISGSPRQVTVYYYASPSDTPVSFTDLSANGSASETTTKLTLTFSQDISGLGAGDVTLSPGTTGAAKGALTRTGTGVYELALSGITAGGQVSVAASKAGYAISGGPRQVHVYYYASPSDTPVSFTGITADGSATETTTKLTLTFSRDISGLEAGDITLSPGTTGAEKGELTRTGTGVYELALSGITAGGQVSIAVSKGGYTISGGPRQVTVYYYTDPLDTQVSFTGITADGSASLTTTKLTLTFSQDISGLEAGDITLSPEATGAEKGELTRTGTGVYELALSGITAGGQVMVAVSKDGYAFTPSSHNTTVHYYAGAAVGIGIGDPSLTLYLDGVPLEGNSTPITRGSGTYTVSIESGTYTGIIWYLNGNEAARGSSRTSIILSKQTAGTYLVTVEASPADGEKNTGSHSFVIQ